MREVVGDLFEAPELCMGHGVNTKAAMFSGIAKVFADKHPEMEKEYNNICYDTWKYVEIPKLFPWWIGESEGEDHFVLNMFTQIDPGANARLGMILDSGLAALKFAGMNVLGDVAIPRIGSGVGGLQWEDVRSTLELAEKLNPYDNEFVVYVKD